MKIGGGIVDFLVTLVVTIVGGLVSEELRSRLDRMPYAVLRVAIRRLPVELRQSVGDEWLAELHPFCTIPKTSPSPGSSQVSRTRSDWCVQLGASDGSFGLCEPAPYRFHRDPRLAFWFSGG